MSQAGTKTPLEPGFVQRVASGMRYMLNGSIPQEWFGPQRPMPSQVPEQEQASVVGRQWDFPAGYNLRTQPRQSDEGVSYRELRALADGYDLLRLVIETRKDQLVKLRWAVKPKDDKKEPDARCKEVEDFLQMPDQEHPWEDWLRALVEDMLVVDAATIYPRRTKGGELYALELMDGTTIKRVLDTWGRTPIPPDSAYVQIIKGVPTTHYTREELLYRPRNVRTHRVYGYSPVEQVLTTVHIALRRQASQLSYYTDGSTPDLILSVPKEWPVDTITKFKKWWDSMLEGNIQTRRGTMFVPEGVTPVNTKEQVLKDQYDEWLARIICFAFSISPQSLMAMMNRATAETAQATAKEEGLFPLMQWVKTTLNLAIWKLWGYNDLTFAWHMQQDVKPTDQATIDKTYVDAKVLTPDEVRARSLNLEPMSPEEREKAFPAPMPAPGAPGSEGEPGKPPGPPSGGKKKKPSAGKVAKARKPSPIDRDRPAVTKPTASLTRAIKRAFASTREDVAKQLAALVGKADSRIRAQQIVQQLDLSGLAVIHGDAEKAIRRVVASGVAVALEQISIDDQGITELANERAEQWAAERAAELVGKKWVDGQLIDNPNPEWSIEEGTRTQLRALVEEAIDGGWSNDTLSAAIEDAVAFSASRAEMVARTETAYADVAGNMIAYRASGVVVGKRWLLAQDQYCDDCAANADEGVIDLESSFSSGDDAPPAHPNCFSGDAVVSAVGVSALFERRFRGEVIVISAAGVDDLTCTPNHPVLTTRGWVRAGDLEIGDDLLKCDGPAANALRRGPHDHYVEARFDQVAGALLVAGKVSTVTVPVAAEDFHGDGIADTEVDVVRPDCALEPNVAELSECAQCGRLVTAHGLPGAFDALGPSTQFVEGHGAASDSRVSVGGERGSIVSGHGGEADRHRGAGSAHRQAHASPSIAQGGTVATDLPSYVHARLAGHVSAVKVTHLVRGEFDGHVYNLETAEGWYLVNGIVAHNCRCDVIPVLSDDEDQEQD